MSKKGEYETGKSKALRVAIIGCFAVFTVFAMIASLLFGSADISFGVILHTLMGNVQTIPAKYRRGASRGKSRRIGGDPAGGDEEPAGGSRHCGCFFRRRSCRGHYADFHAGGIASADASGFHRCDAFRSGGVCSCVEEWYPA